MLVCTCVGVLVCVCGGVFVCICIHIFLSCMYIRAWVYERRERWKKEGGQDICILPFHNKHIMSFTFMYAVSVSTKDGMKDGREEQGRGAREVQCALLLLHALTRGWWGGRLWHERRGPCCAGNAGRGQELLPLLAEPLL